MSIAGRFAALLCCLALSAPTASAALVTLNGTHFSIRYDNLLWHGTAKNPTNFFFTCATSECGGPRWACVFNTIPATPGQPVLDLTDTMVRLMADQATKSLSARGATGITPLAPARRMMLGDNIGAFLSVTSKDAKGVGDARYFVLRVQQDRRHLGHLRWTGGDRQQGRMGG